jgi:hypothetical protein
MNMIVANFLANQLNAPLTMSVQADMAQSSGTVFANNLLGRLDAYRYQNAPVSPPNAYAMYNKELPKQPVDPYGSWSIFAMGLTPKLTKTQVLELPVTITISERGRLGLIISGTEIYSSVERSAIPMRRPTSLLKIQKHS